MSIKNKIYIMICVVICFALNIVSFGNHKEVRLYNFQNAPSIVGSASVSNIEASMHYNLNSALADMVRVIETRNNAKKITYSALSNGQWWFGIQNYSQSTCNNWLYQDLGINANGTCSLVALLSIIQQIRDFNYYSFLGAVDEQDVFEQLYSISVGLGNSYLSANLEISLYGSQVNTIDDILVSFYNQYGISISCSNRRVNDVNNNSLSSIDKYSVISFYDFSEYPIGSTGSYTTYLNSGHSVVLNGQALYSVSYTKYPIYALWGIKETKQFDIAIIANGWYNSSDDQIGRNYQYLVFDDNAYMDVVSINNLFDHLI